MPFATLSGVNLHFVHRPAAPGLPTVVFSNSLGTDLRVWDRLLPHLPAGWGLLRSDMRGHGLSDLAPAETIDVHVADALGLMDRVGIGRAIVCGLSIGGLVAQALAAAHPDRVAAMVLCCSAARVGTAEMWDARIAAAETGGIADLGAPTMGRWFTSAFREEAPEEVAGMAAMLTRQPAAGYIALARALRDTDLQAATRALTLPTLAIAGAEDGAVPPETVRATAGLVPGATFHAIEGVGHMPPVETPERLAAAILAFVHDNGLAGG